MKAPYKESYIFSLKAIGKTIIKKEHVLPNMQVISPSFSSIKSVAILQFQHKAQHWLQTDRERGDRADSWEMRETKKDS